MELINFEKSKNITVTAEGGIFRVFEHKADLSLLSPVEAIQAYYMEMQGIHKRQLVVTPHKDMGFVLSAGAMQFYAGRIEMVSNVKGVGDFIGKAFSAKMTGEKMIKPLYRGTGVLVTEPTYRHLFIVDIAKYGGLIVEDGMFLACEEMVTVETRIAKTLSGAVLGGEGLFNLALSGVGFAVLEARVPYEELIQVRLDKNDELRIDGSYAVMWDDELTMSVEKSGKSMLGSAVSGEGLVNVFRGVGSVWMETSAFKGEYSVRSLR